MLNPDTVAGAGTVMGVLHVLLTEGAEGVLGKTTKYSVSLQDPSLVEYVAVKQPGVVPVNTPVLLLIVPPPLTVQIPGAALLTVNATEGPPAQAFCTVMEGCLTTVMVTVATGLIHPVMLLVHFT